MEVFNKRTGGCILTVRPRALCSHDILSAWSQSIQQPLWLRGQRPLRLIFDEILESGDLGQAWLTLNSKGWTFADATVAIRRLAEVAEDESFNLLASTWIKTVGNDPGGY
jgi:hypothetical protein